MLRSGGEAMARSGAVLPMPDDGSPRRVFARLVQMDRECRGHADAAIDEWLIRGRWGDDLTPQDRAYLLMRISCALDFCNQVAIPAGGPYSALPEPSQTTRDLLRWMLIDLWGAWRAEPWMRLTAMCLDEGQSPYLA